MRGYDRCGGRGKKKTYKKGLRPGRKGLSQVERNDTVIEQFDIMVQRYRAQKAELSFRQLYEDMVSRFYSEKRIVNGETVIEVYPCVMRPTQKQLYYYVRTQITEIEEYELHHGKRAMWNNKRALYSDTITPLKMKAIGVKYEIDEMEVDYELVSRVDHQQTIGRPILYLIVDVFSKMIVGYSLGFDNNSWAGVEMALLNMAEDKVEFCSRLGIKIQEEEWPVHGVLPQEILSDNGSEYLSQYFESYVRQTGVELSFAPPAMGSMKSNVEQKFHQFNAGLNRKIPGRIQRGVYGQPHKKSARLTIDEFEKIVVRFILNYNRNPMDQYPVSRDQFREGISPSPIAIWNYSFRRANGLKKIADMERYKLCLMADGRAKMTRGGIRFKNMLYVCDNLEWLGNEMVKVTFDGEKSIPVKYDKRNLDTLYFSGPSGKMGRAWLSERKYSNQFYQNLSIYEIELADAEKTKRRADYAEERLRNNLNCTQEISAIVKDAKKKHKASNRTEDTRQHRQLEKELTHKKRHIDLEEQQSMEIRGSLEDKIEGARETYEGEVSFEKSMSEVSGKSTYELIEAQRRARFQK